MLFMRRPNYQPKCLKKRSPDHGTKTERCVYICCWSENLPAVKTGRRRETVNLVSAGKTRRAYFRAEISQQQGYIN